MALVELAHPQRLGQGQRMGETRLVGFRRHHPHIVGQGARDPLQHLQSLGVDAVIVGQKNAHTQPILSRPPI